MTDHKEGSNKCIECQRVGTELQRQRGNASQVRGREEHPHSPTSEVLQTHPHSRGGVYIEREPAPNSGSDEHPSKDVLRHIATQDGCRGACDNSGGCNGERRGKRINTGPEWTSEFARLEIDRKEYCECPVRGTIRNGGSTYFLRHSKQYIGEPL